MGSPPYPTDLYPGCPCYTCDSETWPLPPGWTGTRPPMRMSLCPACGNKRCFGAGDHATGCEQELGPTCVYCAHPVSSHDTTEGCAACGCTRVVFFDDDRGDE